MAATISLPSARVPDQHGAFVDGHAVAREPGAGNVVGAVDRPDRDAGEIGGDHGGRVQMRDGPVPGIGQHGFDVDGQFVGNAVAVEFTGAPALPSNPMRRMSLGRVNATPASVSLRHRMSRRSSSTRRLR